MGNCAGKPLPDADVTAAITAGRSSPSDPHAAKTGAPHDHRTSAGGAQPRSCTPTGGGAHDPHDAHTAGAAGAADGSADGASSNKDAADGAGHDRPKRTISSALEGPGEGADKARRVLGKTLDIKSIYTFDKVLGKGQFGVTRLVVDRVTGEQLACKSISKRKLVSAEDMEDVRREIRVMHHLSGHPHVVAFKGAYEDNFHVHIVMELCTGGELFEHIAAKGHYREKDAAHLMRTILQVIHHCHSMNVVHRDLKPENFLFGQPGRRHLKAIDFGLSSFFKEGVPLKDMVGSPFYMAPEVLKRSYSKEADIWSCGVMLYILLCGWPPFYGSSAQQIFRAIMNDSLDLASPPWDTLSPLAKDCVKRMLVRDPARRATAGEILTHEWMRENGAAPDLPMQPEILTRMRRFAGMNKLKKEALKVIATTLEPEEIEGIRQMFVEMDSDSSGTISFEELRDGLRKRGAHLADSEIQRIMAECDLDGNHTLDFQEFLTATCYLGKLEKRENMLSAFQHFDTDHSGFLTEDVLRHALSSMHGIDQATIDNILTEVDRDDDHRIDYDEFCRMMLSDVTQPLMDRNKSRRITEASHRAIDSPKSLANSFNKSMRRTNTHMSRHPTNAHLREAEEDAAQSAAGAAVQRQQQQQQRQGRQQQQRLQH